MADLFIDDLEETLVERLKARGRTQGRSLEEEVKAILENTCGPVSMAEARKLAEEWQHRLAGRIQGSSADLLREARNTH